MNSQTTIKQYKYNPVDIPLLEQHQWRSRIRSAWIDFIAMVPLPALWITAHLDFTTRSAATVDCLKNNLTLCRSRDAIATQYRVFLQKFITPLNRIILKSRSPYKTFSFRGCLEPNTSDFKGTQLHFHFFLWEPSGLFLRNQSQMLMTADSFDWRWHQKVNDIHSDRYKPIVIKPVFTHADAIAVSRYTLKRDTFDQSYELFDDWSSSRHMENINRTTVKFQPPLNRHGKS